MANEPVVTKSSPALDQVEGYGWLIFSFCFYLKAFMKLDKTKYEDDKMDQQKEEEERLLIVMVTINHQQVNSPYNMRK